MNLGKKNAETKLENNVILFPSRYLTSIHRNFKNKVKWSHDKSPNLEPRLSLKEEVNTLKAVLLFFSLKKKENSLFFWDDKNQYQLCSHAIGCDGILQYHTRCKCKPTSLTSDLNQLFYNYEQI